MTDFTLTLALISSAVLRHWSSSTSPITTLAPSPTKRRASAAPCPRAPPEIRATLPLSRSMGFASLIIFSTRLKSYPRSQTLHQPCAQTGDLRAQFLEQRLGVLKVCGVE